MLFDPSLKFSKHVGLQCPALPCSARFYMCTHAQMNVLFPLCKGHRKVKLQNCSNKKILDKHHTSIHKRLNLEKGSELDSSNQHEWSLELLSSVNQDPNSDTNLVST